MGDLDVSLIKEFALRPAFYNKANPHFKDKSYNDQAWAEIAAKLGYDVMLLKDRIYQLRNRYNLEKRKVEHLRDSGESNARSTWPLFNNLTFLDGHIRPRKSYKSMMRRSSTDHQTSNHQSRHSSRNDNSRDESKAHHYANSALQQMMQIKYEDGGANDDHDVVLYQSGYDTEDERRGQNGHFSGDSHADDSNFINPATFLVDDDNDDKDSDSDHPTSDEPEQRQQSNRSAGNISLRNINSLKRKRSKSPIEIGSGSSSRAGGNIGGASSSAAHNRSTPLNNDCDSLNLNNKGPSTTRQRTSADKFDAFGTFMATSLTDLPERKALELVEKFTSEIVKALLSKFNEDRN